MKISNRNSNPHRLIIPRLWLLGVLAAVILAGCNSAQRAETELSAPEGGMGGAPASAPYQEEAAKQAASMEVDRMALDQRSRAEYNAPARGDANAAAPAAPQESLKPQLIRRATINMKVDDISEAVNKIQFDVKTLGGYITNQNLSLSEDAGAYRSGSLEIRLPAASLDAFINGVGRVGVVLSKQVTAEDVSKQLVDLEAFVINKRKEEESLQQIMKRSGKIEEVLRVAQELARVRGEIEQAEGQRKYLREQVAYSTVTVYLSEKTVGSPVDTKPTPDTVLGNAIQQAWSALYGFLMWLMAAVIWILLYVVPVLAIFGVILFLLFKGVLWATSPLWRRSKRTQEKAAAKSPADNPPSPPPAE